MRKMDDAFQAMPDRSSHVRPYGCFWRGIVLLDIAVGIIMFFTAGSYNNITNVVTTWFWFNVFFIPISFVLFVALAYGTFFGKWGRNIRNRP